MGYHVIASLVWRSDGRDSMFEHVRPTPSPVVKKPYEYLRKVGNISGTNATYTKCLAV